MNNSKDSLGDRMKGYENVTRGYLQKKTPVIIRVDGRAFHTFTRQMKKPFDEHFVNAMGEAARELAREMQGFKLAYVQSDEASFFLGDYDYEKTGAWYDYNINKIVSISSALMTSYFSEKFQLKSIWEQASIHPVFDSRAFNVPKEDVLNYFLWRAKDWKRNSVQMVARSIFSHNQLKNKKQEEMLDMIRGTGYNWDGISEAFKYGKFIYKSTPGLCYGYIPPTYQAFSSRWGYLVGENNE